MLPGDPVAAQNTVDVLHYDMDVTVEDQELIETVTLTVRAAALPKRWTLVRANAVKVLSAVSAGKKIPLSAGNGAVHLDLSGLGDGGPEALQITSPPGADPTSSLPSPGEALSAPAFPPRSPTSGASTPGIPGSGATWPRTR